MTQRTKKQHTLPRFYLRNFCDDEGYLWTHDSRLGEARRTTPENTGIEKNIYSPELEDGQRFDEIEDFLSVIESTAAPLLNNLLGRKPLDAKEKCEFAMFVASMFIRSPAQIRQFAAITGDMASQLVARYAELDIMAKQKNGEPTDVESRLLDLLSAQGAMMIGAVMNAPEKGARPYWNFALQVADIDAAKTAVENGAGTVRTSPSALPDDSGWLIQASDPQGARIMFTGPRRAGS